MSADPGRPVFVTKTCPSQLPAYAPDLNPVEGIWSSLRRTSLANIAFTDYTHLVTAVRRGLRQIQYRPTIITGCLIGTGLATSPGDITHQSSVVL